MKKGFAIFFLLCSSFAAAQSNDLLTGLNSTQKNIIEGVSEGISWHDGLLLSYLISRNYIPANDQNKLSILTSGFEKNIQNNVGRSGRSSIGGMDPYYFPNIIFYARIIYTLGKDLINGKSSSKDDYKHAFLFGKSILYTFAITDLTKNTINRTRPDGSDTRSFFSGHTSTAFATSTFLYRELNDYFNSSSLTSNDDILRNICKTFSFVTLYGWASYVGYTRMQDNKHYLSDVLIGAAAGTIISNVIYDFYLNEDVPLLENVNIGIIDHSPVLSFHIDF